ncbi:MAG: hypothetical protein CL496_01235 [Actinobacteria bacterium]|jgi:hypothetical protein|nr:hypothetical protein [Actinomycetota bacterium]
MPAIFINPTNKEHEKLLQKLDIQNQDLRVFASDKLPTDFIERLPGKKAIGDIEDDSHISTASEGAYCGIYHEDIESRLRKVFIDSIHNSSLKRIIWISTKEPSEKILSIKNLVYINYVEGVNYQEKVLELEEVEKIKDSIINLK